MRPTRLLLDGFGSYAEPCELDLSDLRVVAVSGKNGAGKSTLLDAMLWAMYGTVPGRAAADVICEHRDSARVEFDMEIAEGPDADIGVHRLIRQRTDRKGEASHIAPDGTVTTGSRAVESAVSRLIGGDIQSLTATTFARQGDVAAFAEMSAADRRTFLLSVLPSAVALDDARPIVDDARRQAASAAAKAEQRADTTAEESALIDSALASLEEAEAEAAEAEAEAARLDELSRGPDPGDLAAAERAAARLDEIDELIDSARIAQTEAETALTAAERVAERKQKSSDTAAAALASAAASLASADTALAESADRLETVEAAADGEDADTECWVCGGPLTIEHIEEIRAEHDTAKAARDQAKKAETAARRRSSETAAAAREAAADERRLRSRADDRKAEIRSVKAEIAALRTAAARLDELRAAADAAETDDREVAAAARALAAAQRRLGAAQAAVAAARRAQAALPRARSSHAEAEAELRSHDLLAKACSPSGVPLLAVSRAIDHLTAHAGAAAQALGECELRFSVSEQGQHPTVLIEARSPTGGWRDYRSFSGGERMRLDVATRIGLSRAAGLRSRTMVLDEGHGALDSDASIALQALMARLVDSGEMESVWTVSHIGSVLDAFDERIVVERGVNGSTARVAIG